MTAAALALLLLLPGPEQVVITRDGKRLVGEVSREGATFVVKTLVETVQVPEDRVFLIFRDPSEARDEVSAQLDQCKRIYEEAAALPEKDPLRRHRFSVALAKCSETRDLVEILCRYYDTDAHGFLRLMREIPQFMRLIRDQMGSALAMPVVAGRKGEEVGLEVRRFEFTAPAAPDRTWIHGGDLGTGQGAILAGLAAESPKAREEALKKLVSPPAPHALGAIVRLWEKETDENVLRGVVDACWRLDVEPLFKKKDLAFLKNESDPKRKYAVADLAKRLGTKTACAFLAETLRDGAVTENRTRGMYCSAFRRMRAWAADELKESYLKTSDYKAKGEICKQLGMLRDPKGALVLRLAMSQFAANPGTKVHWGTAYYALELVGKPAMPAAIEAMSDRNDDVRRCGKALAQRFSGENEENSQHYVKWWQTYHKIVEDEELKWWAEQATKDYPVDPGAFKYFDRKFQEPRN